MEGVGVDGADALEKGNRISLQAYGERPSLSFVWRGFDSETATVPTGKILRLKAGFEPPETGPAALARGTASSLWCRDEGLRLRV